MCVRHSGPTASVLGTSSLHRQSRNDLAPIAEDVRDVGPQPVGQDAPLVEPMRKPNGPRPQEVARHELTHLPAGHDAKLV